MVRTPSGNAPGRPRKPTALKVLHGDYKVHPETRNRREPLPSTAVVEPPSSLSKPARELWDRLVPDMIATHTVTRWDEAAMAEMLEAVVMAKVTRGRAIREEKGEALPPGQVPGIYAWRASVAVFNSLASRFGMTPADRSRLITSASDDDGDDLISGGFGR